MTYGKTIGEQKSLDDDLLKRVIEAYDLIQSERDRLFQKVRRQ